jgi:IS605 OrfB family transposase
MIKAHKIRLHPTPEQAQYFAKAAGTARFTFNWALAEWKQQYETGGKPSALSLKKQFHAIRKEQFPWTYDVSKSVVEGAFMDLACGFKKFFEGLKTGKKRGYPKFKSKKRSRQAFYLANDRFTVGDHWVGISKLGRVNMAEKFRFSGKLISARVSKTASWWFFSITVELPDETPAPPTRPNVGIDVGLNRLATLSDGTQFENQKPLRTLLKQLRASNKKLARCVKGSANWYKAKKKLARLHYRIACMRDDLLHKLTTEIARTAGLVGVESLHLKGLIQNRKLALSFSDAALGKLLHLLESKVTHDGGTVVKVDRFYPSSQLCHRCGWRWADITLADRVFVCQHPTCGWCGDRDYNAAVNILNEALRLIGVALSDEAVPVVAMTAPKIASGLGVRPKRR